MPPSFLLAVFYSSNKEMIVFHSIEALPMSHLFSFSLSLWWFQCQSWSLGWGLGFVRVCRILSCVSKYDLWCFKTWKINVRLNYCFRPQILYEVCFLSLNFEKVCFYTWISSFEKKKKVQRRNSCVKKNYFKVQVRKSNFSKFKGEKWTSYKV